MTIHVGTASLWSQFPALADLLRGTHESARWTDFNRGNRTPQDGLCNLLEAFALVESNRQSITQSLMIETNREFTFALHRDVQNLTCALLAASEFFSDAANLVADLPEVSDPLHRCPTEKVDR